MSINGRRLAVVLPAYNAARTLLKTIAELDRTVVDDVILVDDSSTDDTWTVAGLLEGDGVARIRHPANQGDGGNQKTC